VAIEEVPLISVSRPSDASIFARVRMGARGGMKTRIGVGGETSPPSSAAPAYPPARIGRAEGWTAQRREVIDRAGGVCALCGMPGADTVFRGRTADGLVAAHTRCVLGLGPSTEPSAP
jgi:hypothetical protein